MIEPNDDQGTIVRWKDHIVPILENPDIHIRDKALVAVAWELHPRTSELHQLTFSDVEDRDDHIAIMLTRRDGNKRLLPLSGSMPYFKKWIQAGHPVTELLGQDADTIEEAPPETPIWTHIHSNESIHPDLLYDIMNRACERSDVSTKFKLYDIRRSRAKLLAAQSGLRVPELRELFGWGPQMAEEFVKIVKDDEFNEDIKPRPPIRCPNCGAWTPQYQPCIWCGPGR